MRNKSSILVAADHALVRCGMRCLLAADGAYDVAECGLAEVEVAAGEHAPDLIVFAPSAGDVHVLERVRTLRRSLPAPHLVLLVPAAATIDLKEALFAGVRGFVSEEEAVHELRAAAEQVLAGQTFVGSDLMERLVYLIATDARSGGGSSRLSEREVEVLRLSGQGYRPRVIADALRVSAKTVHTHRENLKRKLQVESMAELDRFAVRWLRGEVSL